MLRGLGRSVGGEGKDFLTNGVLHTPPGNLQYICTLVFTIQCSISLNLTFCPHTFSPLFPTTYYTMSKGHTLFQSPIWFYTQMAILTTFPLFFAKPRGWEWEIILCQLPTPPPPPIYSHGVGLRIEAGWVLPYPLSLLTQGRDGGQGQPLHLTNDQAQCSQDFVSLTCLVLICLECPTFPSTLHCVLSVPWQSYKTKTKNLPPLDHQITKSVIRLPS